MYARLNLPTDEVDVPIGFKHIWEFAKETPGDKDANSVLDKFILHLIQRFGKVPRIVYGSILFNPVNIWVTNLFGN